MKDHTTLLNILYEDDIITLTPKLDKNLTEKEFYRLKFFYMLANYIQQYINIIQILIHHNQVGLT